MVSGGLAENCLPSVTLVLPAVGSQEVLVWTDSNGTHSLRAKSHENAFSPVVADPPKLVCE
jgi:hypothetical protein